VHKTFSYLGVTSCPPPPLEPCCQSKVCPATPDPVQFWQSLAPNPPAYPMPRIHKEKIRCYIEMGKQTFLNSKKFKIRKFLGSFRYRKFTNFLGVPVRKSQIRQFL
jgi:hypothetical protein